MKRRILSLVLAIAVCTSLGVTATAAYETDTGVETTSGLNLEPKSEYQMALEETQRTRARMGTKTPLEEYKEAFDVRARMDADTLRSMGYSEEEIAILQEYNDGNCSFEEAATKASAVLTPSVSSSMHTGEKYSVTYSWEWDRIPTGLGQDGFAMGLCGIDDQSMGFITKVDIFTASVTYYYTDNVKYKSESPEKTITTSGVSAKFQSYKMDDARDRWVFAKKGTMTAIITPAVTGKTKFAAVRVVGGYGHSSTTRTKINVSVKVDVKSGDVTTTFTVSSSSSGTVTTYGKKQVIFYNDGSKFVEV